MYLINRNYNMKIDNICILTGLGLNLTFESIQFKNTIFYKESNS